MTLDQFWRWGVAVIGLRLKTTAAAMALALSFNGLAFADHDLEEDDREALRLAGRCHAAYTFSAIVKADLASQDYGAYDVWRVVTPDHLLNKHSIRSHAADQAQTAYWREVAITTERFFELVNAQDVENIESLFDARINDCKIIGIKAPGEMTDEDWKERYLKAGKGIY